MNKYTIIEKVAQALDRLIERDGWLLTDDLSERSITHKLGEHLQDFFQEMDVDCEYNGNAGEPGSRKRIQILKDQLERFDLLRDAEWFIDQEFISRFVYPDIIVHRRASHENNLCAIEVKKSTSQIPRDYDRLKLKAYTSGEFGNNLEYHVGIFIELKTGQNDLGYFLEFFENGVTIPVTIDPPFRF